MRPEELQKIEFFRSNPTLLEFAVGKIDAEKGILYDVVTCEEGKAKGHGVSLEGEFISEMVAYDKAQYGDAGVKARFGHVFGSAAMGAQLGYFKNPRTRKRPDGKMQAIADLHLIKASDNSPTKPGMYSWVLSMSQEAPDFMMSSIVFQPGRYYQKKANGHKKYVWECTSKRANGRPDYGTWVDDDPEMGDVYVEFGSKGAHYFTDLVDDGAATNNLFENQTFNPSPELVEDKPKTTFTMSLRELLFGKENPAEDATFTPAQVAEFRTQVETSEKQITALATERDGLKTQVTTLTSDLATAKTDLETATKRVEELEKLSADVHTKGKKETETTPPVANSWDSNPINLKAKQMAEANTKPLFG